jgi:hypothetical protein
MSSTRHQYSVRWEVEVVAESPEDAAKKARTIARRTRAVGGDRLSKATIFDVQDETGLITRVDLDEVE